MTYLFQKQRDIREVNGIKFIVSEIEDFISGKGLFIQIDL